MTKKPKSFPRDPEATKERLMRAAERHFVQKGFDRARVDEIAEDAQSNKRMIYAYYGDKEGLYQAILDHHFEGLLDHLSAAVPTPGDARKDAEELIRVYFAFLAQNPSFVRLVSWESLRFGRQAGRHLLKGIPASLAKLFAILQRGVDQGVFRSDLDVRTLVGSVYGLCLSHFSQHEFLKRMRQESEDPADKSNERYLQHILRLIFDGILAP
jgi:TetR/AcrR family transcriptional regulator